VQIDLRSTVARRLQQSPAALATEDPQTAWLVKADLIPLAIACHVQAIVAFASECNMHYRLVAAGIQVF
jgi:hypothetical protein